jgi:putative N6-adenine-specific DNA methylase
MYLYQKTNRYFAQISDTMEDLGVKELKELGAEDVKPSFRGVFFNADKETLYKINYCSRFITRVLAPIITFDCHSTNYLYKTARKIDWTSIFSLNNTFAIFSAVSNSSIRHSQYASLCLKDAIVDSFRDMYGERPNVEPHYPDVWINLHIRNNKATISIETSGGSLHRRGYRKDSLEAPMQETLAAAIVELSGWAGSQKLYDPMCGSGTLICESIIKYSKIPTAYFRNKFGFEFLPDFDSKVWMSVKNKIDRQIKPLKPNLIYGSDISNKAIKIAKLNTKTFKDGNQVSYRTIDFRDIDSIEDSIIITNPPYGLRLGDRDKVGILIKEFGDFLKQKCKGSTAYIYFGNRELIKKIGLRSAFKIPLKNGGLDGRLVKFELY